MSSNSLETIYPFEVQNIQGQNQSLEAYRGKVVLVVNTASKCGLTPHYEGLEALYRKYKDQGLVILGFPCNQFGEQEPGTEAEIMTFCDLNYQISFPMFKKVDVNGDNAHPLYKFLKSSKKGLLGSEAIKWNFTKFLIGKDGVPLQRYAPTTEPSAIEVDVVEALKG